MSVLPIIPKPFPELAQAIERGAEAVHGRQSYGVFINTERDSLCVLGAAYLGHTGELPDYGLSHHVTTVLASAFPELQHRDEAYLLPDLQTAPLSLYTLLAQLNDLYAVPLHALSQWVRGESELLVQGQPVTSLMSQKCP